MNLQQGFTLPIDTDGTLAANSDAKIASQKATKTYADTKIGGSTGSTDRAVLIANGTGGLTAQAVPAVIDTGNTLTLKSVTGETLVIEFYTGTPNRGGMIFKRSDGTPGSPTGVQSGDVLGGVQVYGHDGTAMTAGGRGLFQFKAAETWASGFNGTRFTLELTPTGGSTTRREVMTVEQDGSMVLSQAFLNVSGGWIRTKSYTVATVPSASTAGAGAQIYVSNESGGATVAFSDGTNWRRVADRAIIS